MKRNDGNYGKVIPRQVVPDERAPVYDKDGDPFGDGRRRMKERYRTDGLYRTRSGFMKPARRTAKPPGFHRVRRVVHVRPPSSDIVVNEAGPLFRQLRRRSGRSDTGKGRIICGDFWDT